MDSLERTRDALNSIPSDLPRDDWVKAGMAFQAAGGSFDDFDRWSAQAPSYNATSCKQTWQSFKAEGNGSPPITAGTLFGMARDYGWKEPYQNKPGVDFSQFPSNQIKPKPATAPVIDPVVIWNRGEPATPEHAYIDSKGATGAPLGRLRVVPADDPLRIMSESMAGALMVPVLRPNGDLVSLQFITVGDTAERLKVNGKATKLNLPGASMDGWFTVGDLLPGGVAYLCEGIGTAWAAWMAKGSAAVVCFGAGNMGKVAQALRLQDSAARLVVCPDVGKEAQAQSIATAVRGAVAAMPEGWPNNSDLHDLGQRDGFDAVATLLDSAKEPPGPEPHPLARFVELDGVVRPPRWVVPGFIGHGVTVISGAHGIGKTTAFLPLALVAAGLHGGELMPQHWRHVVYVTEDLEQATRILSGIVQFGGLGIDERLVRDRLHLVEAKRLDPEFVACVGTTYRDKFARTIEGVEALPLVVFDTKSAVLALDNENDNSEASRMMSALKQGFDRLPVWLIGHVAKTNLSRKDVLTARGASAIEADANQTLFLIQEGERRFLLRGKTRFETKWPELEITSHTAEIMAPNEFGFMETVFLRWGVAAPASRSRKEAAEQAAEGYTKKNR
ncbi:MAG: AAA family ATPase, partial [Alcaligenaceae bacterium]|nr:AAA family ATPase [Alcaligenaceae bacterium]